MRIGDYITTVYYWPTGTNYPPSFVISYGQIVEFYKGLMRYEVVADIDPIRRMMTVKRDGRCRIAEDGDVVEVNSNFNLRIIERCLQFGKLSYENNRKL